MIVQTKKIRDLFFPGQQKSEVKKCVTLNIYEIRAHRVFQRFHHFHLDLQPLQHPIA